MSSKEASEANDEDLARIRAALMELTDKRNHLSTFTQAKLAAIYIAFVNDQLKVLLSGLSLAKFPEIEHYPKNRGIDPHRLLAVRGTLNMMVGFQARKTAPALDPLFLESGPRN